MQTTTGEKATQMSWQAEFPQNIKCESCGGESRIIFVSHEGITEFDKSGPFVCNTRKNGGKGDFWPHDCVAVAIYLCKDCFHFDALGNQG